MRQRTAGFTLIEVLIALSVLAIALVAFVSAGAQNADYATYIRERTIGQWVARNQLVTYQMASQWPDIGRDEDDVQMAGQTWHWEATIQGSPDPRVRRVDVRVYPVRPDTDRPADDPLLTMTGFLTQHVAPRNDADSNETGGQTPPSREAP